MNYPLFWFVLIGVLWTGYLVLEGFDFGVGSLLPVLGTGADAAETEKRRRVMLTTIGPHWDGNEVWLITAGGAMFAAFPHWYATMFSAMYLPLLLVLVALIIRNMGLEYRHKRDDDTWRRRWDLAIITGSVLPPLLVGVALTNLVRGLPLDANFDYRGDLLDLLNLPSLLGGLAVLALSLTHGAFFLALKTEGEIRRDARRLGSRTAVAAVVLVGGLLLWLTTQHGSVPVVVAAALSALGLATGVVGNLRGQERLAFAGTALAMTGVVAGWFLALYPALIPTTLAGGTSLTVVNGASSTLTLQIMSIAAVCFTPIVIAYTVWTYWVFRKRIAVHHIPEPVSVR